jgi:hypothetical protein
MENITWSGGAAIQYTVWGIGKHNIRCIFDYEVYVFIPGGIQLVTGTITQDDSIYLFDMNQHPIIKPKVTNGTAILFYLYKEGFFHLKLIIDDRLVKEINYTYSHH